MAQHTIPDVPWNPTSGRSPEVVNGRSRRAKATDRGDTTKSEPIADFCLAFDRLAGPAKDIRWSRVIRSDSFFRRNRKRPGRHHPGRFLHVARRAELVHPLADTPVTVASTLPGRPGPEISVLANNSAPHVRRLRNRRQVHGSTSTARSSANPGARFGVCAYASANGCCWRKCRSGSRRRCGRRAVSVVLHPEGDGRGLRRRTACGWVLGDDIPVRLDDDRLAFDRIGGRHLETQSLEFLLRLIEGLSNLIRNSDAFSRGRGGWARRFCGSSFGRGLARASC